jgi:hypothetical protein
MGILMIFYVLIYAQRLNSIALRLKMLLSKNVNLKFESKSQPINKMTTAVKSCYQRT